MLLLLRATADSPEEPNSCSKAAIVNISSILGSLGEKKTGGGGGVKVPPLKGQPLGFCQGFLKGPVF